MFLRALAARDGHTSGSSEFTNCPASAHSAPTNTNRRHAASIRDHSIHLVSYRFLAVSLVSEALSQRLCFAEK